MYAIANEYATILSITNRLHDYIVHHRDRYYIVLQVVIVRWFSILPGVTNLTLSFFADNKGFEY